MRDVSSGPSPSNDPSRFVGLTEDEAAARLAAEGPNELSRRGRRTLLRIALGVLREPMLALLLAGGVIYLALGDVQEAALLLLFACFSIVIAIVQEARSERALEALRSLASPRALVLRDGSRRLVPGREVVRGDLVVLSEGDRVPADGWIVENVGLRLDESLLTGESVPVAKAAAATIAGPPPRPGGEGLPYAFAGALVVGGSGLCHVAATGRHTEMGRIGQSLASIDAEPSGLFRQTRRLVLIFAAAGGAVSLLAMLLYGLLRGSWLEGALAGIALGMSLLPEEIPVVLTVFMAMGAMRMSRVRVLTRRAAAIEALGSATTLCTDKTGTLTQNRMTIARLWLPDGRLLDHGEGTALGDDFWSLAELGILASAPEPVDPMEIAFHDLGAQRRSGDLPRRQQPDWDLRRRYPLDPRLLAVSHVWNTGAERDDQIVATKGAPEAIADLCGLDPNARRDLLAAARRMATDGLRVLGIAEAPWSGPGLPTSQRDFRFVFRGLVGLHDPLRPSVPEAVRDCRRAGIRIVMITGDYPETAQAIARAAGLGDGELMTGAMLDSTSDEALAAKVGQVAVFARVMPEQKLRIVEALKAAGQIVAMTGDGVNDAPSLKAAHIGIAMGGRGTDVAREAAAIVLLDDDFGSIATAIRVGRRTYDNLRKAMGFIISVHVPIAGLALMPLLFGLPIMLTPIHIALLEMIIDPVCSLVFEAEIEERNVMRRPPRRPDAALLSRSLLGWALVQGIVAFAAIAAIVGLSVGAGASEPLLRTLAFVTLVVMLLGLVLVNRSFSTSIMTAIRRPNRALVLVSLVVALLLASSQMLPPVTALLGLVALGTAQAGAIAALVVAVVLLLELVKKRWHRGRAH